MTTAQHTGAGPGALNVANLIDWDYGKHSQANASESVHDLLFRFGHVTRTDLPTEPVPAVAGVPAELSPWVPDFGKLPVIRVGLLIWLAVVLAVVAILVSLALSYAPAALTPDPELFRAPPSFTLPAVPAVR